MSENKQIGIGYTIFEYDGNKKKRPLTMVTSRPGNFWAEIRKLEKRMEQNRRLMQLCIGAFAYGYMVRFVLGM